MTATVAPSSTVRPDMNKPSIKQYQTVSIWIGQSGYAVRGYYRACSYLLSQHDSLDAAAAAALATPRKQNSVALVPKWDPAGSAELL